MVKQYLDHSREILASELTDFKGGSKGMGLISLFGYQNRYDLKKGFPLLTTKKINVNWIIHELIWFLRGGSNIKYLADNKVNIWDGNALDHNLRKLVAEGILPESALERYSKDWESAKEEYVQRIREDHEFAERWGEVGRLYGSQWRHWKYVDDNGNPQELDQIGTLIDSLRKKPTSKRSIVVGSNPGDNLTVSQPPCHILFHVNGNEERQMDLQLYQRSCDMFLGVPFNIASYAMLAQIIAQQAGLEPRYFIHSFGDSHFYTGDGERAQWYKDNLSDLQERVKGVNKREDYLEVLGWLDKNLPKEREETQGMDHITAIIKQLSRDPRQLPTLKITNKDFDKLVIDDFTIKGYDPHPYIKRTMAV